MPRFVYPAPRAGRFATVNAQKTDSSIAHFQEVSKNFGGHTALSDLSFEVKQGEVLGLLGPNGAGKTTALRLLCGLIAPDRGKVEVCGHDAATNPLQARKRLSFVPDGAPLYANLSPRQHLTLVGRLHGIEEADHREEGARLLEALELDDRADDPIGQFSRGMRQKAALACALLPRPRLLALDEPLSGLDAPTTAVFKEVLKSWAKRGGAVLYTSHLLDVVERVCDRMVILCDGRLVGMGSLEDLREGAGVSGTLEEVFARIAQAEDPVSRAQALLGDLEPS
jgi:ABC-2 type transport system ATP-binding protein